MSSVAVAADRAAPARPARLRVLLLEDNPLDAELVVSELDAVYQRVARTAPDRYR